MSVSLTFFELSQLKNKNKQKVERQKTVKLKVNFKKSNHFVNSLTYIGFLL